MASNRLAIGQGLVSLLQGIINPNTSQTLYGGSRLKQPTTFRPFMWQSSLLALVTPWARNNNVRRVIGSATTQRNDMIGMIPSQFFMTIIALTTLPSILALYILACQCTAIITFECSIFVSIGTQFMEIISSPLASLFGMLNTILTSIGQYLGAMSFTILTFICHSLLIVCLTILLPSLTHFFRILLTISDSIQSMSFAVLACKISCSSSPTCYALCTNTRRPIYSHMKVFGGSRKHLKTPWTSFVSCGYIVFLFLGFGTTCFAAWNKLIISTFSNPKKVFWSCWKALFTLCALLHAFRDKRFNFGFSSTYLAPRMMPIRITLTTVKISKEFDLLAMKTLLALWNIREYTTHTLSLLTCLASRPGVLLAPLGLNNYSSNYTTNQHAKPVQGVFYAQ